MNAALLSVAPAVANKIAAPFDAFIDELKKKDWMYEYSDDGSVWRAGDKHHQEIQAKASQDIYLAEAYSIYEHWAFRHERKVNVTRDELKDDLALVREDYINAQLIQKKCSNSN